MFKCQYGEGTHIHPGPQWQCETSIGHPQREARYVFQAVSNPQCTVPHKYCHRTSYAANARTQFPPVIQPNSNDWKSRKADIQNLDTTVDSQTPSSKMGLRFSVKPLCNSSPCRPCYRRLPQDSTAPILTPISAAITIPTPAPQPSYKVKHTEMVPR